MKHSLEQTVTMRPVAQDDLPFLQQVYFSTRTDELQAVDWSDDQKTAFLRMQFEAQHRHYLTHFSNASFQIILRQGTPAGRLYVNRTSDEIRIIDIALLPEHRRAGLGSAILQSILHEGVETGRPVRIYVEHFNPALGLYKRLGFSRIGDTGVYYHMEWLPPQAGQRIS